jgi:hypothetical protein
MKPIKSLLVLAIMCAPALASAQRYYNGRGGNPDGRIPGGFHNRAGRLTVGVSLGLGGMHDNGSAITSCFNCDFKPYTGEISGHIGGMLSHRFALMFEGQANFQTIESSFRDGDTVLTQSAAMVAGQFWVLPQLWIKGGLGFSNLRIDDEFFTEEIGNGVALMAAAGVELFSARNFAFELQGRVIEGTYNGGDDNITAGTIGIGVNWY